MRVLSLRFENPGQGASRIVGFRCPRDHKQVQRDREEEKEQERYEERLRGCRAGNEEFRINRRDWCIVWAAARSPN